MLVSPAEPHPYSTLGKSSSLPEQLGADFLIFSPLYGRVGVQRKTISDLVNSLHDGRVQREVIDQAGLDLAVWVLEGRVEWNSDGQLIGSRTTYTRAQHHGVIFSLLSRGCWIMQVDSQPECVGLLSSLRGWMAKRKHQSLLTRPGLVPTFAGMPSLKEQQVHFMQGLPGMGYERSKRVIEHFHGLPFKLDGDLEEVDGVGKKTVERVKEMFG